MKIKICGITNLGDATECQTLGVNYLGFIFYKKSPRYINYSNAKKIIAGLNSKVQKVGVFVNTDNNEINTISKDIGLDYVQLHGNEGVEDIFEIKLPCIKALDGNSRSLSDNINMFKNAKYLLLDNISKNIKGGSGNKFDWNNLKNIDNKKNIILSGGLSQENILDAIDKTDIEFYDFCSSTEIKPGIKNIKKIESIVNLINNAKK
tara:strand:+ start:109760 stop:110377 length:618 start_codon:yes stop_codon:yes gene_type:complete